MPIAKNLLALCFFILPSALGAQEEAATATADTATAAAKESRADEAEATSKGLHVSLEPLAPFLGTWVIDGAWQNGTRLWSKSHFVPVLKGRFLEITTWVRDGDGEPYLRYHSMVGTGSEKDRFNATSFQHDGTQSAVEYHLSEPGHLEWTWTAGSSEIRESYQKVAIDQTRWQVWVRQGAEQEWSPLMDGTWKKVEGPATSPIEDSQFVGHGPDVRRFEQVETIAAPASEIFSALSDQQAFIAAYGPDREELRANIDLAIGGRYEWLFDGKIGSNGCQILSYVPDRLISFTWNAPPTQANSREKRTWVVVELDSQGEQTEVRLTHLGFGKGAEWDETFEYFQKAWAFVLGTLKKNLEATSNS